MGIGFGPSGISLACAIEDLAESTGAVAPLGRVRFLEKAADSAWHPHMLLADTDIQHHFLRDLATPRDPRSRFTFANYLKEKGRLYEFGELALGAPGGAVSRLEWSDYLMWAADQLRHYVRYDTEVVEIRALRRGAQIDRLELVTPEGELATRALVLALGRTPVIPAELDGALGPTVFHSSRFRAAIADLDRTAPMRVAVVGSGQSAVEILAFLHGAFPASLLVSVHRGLGFKHVDLSPFSNEIFHPTHVDHFHSLEPEPRRAVLREARQTNFGVVDAEAAGVLYRRLYEDMVRSVPRVQLVTSTRITSWSGPGSPHRLGLEHVHTGETSELDVDVVVLCTGYEEERVPSLLGSMADLLCTDAEGNPQVARDYRIETRPELAVPIYLSGLSERTHGPSDAASFSMIALRAERVVSSLLEGAEAERS